MEVIMFESLNGQSFKSKRDTRVKEKLYTILKIYQNNGITYVQYQYQWNGKQGIGGTRFNMIQDVWYNPSTGQTISEILNLAPEKKETKKESKKRVKKEVKKEEVKKTQEVKEAPQEQPVTQQLPLNL